MKFHADVVSVAGALLRRIFKMTYEIPLTLVRNELVVVGICQEIILLMFENQFIYFRTNTQ